MHHMGYMEDQTRSEWEAEKTQLTNSEEARDRFKSLGLTYKDITQKALIELVEILNQELVKFDNKGFKMKLEKVLQKDVHFNTKGAFVKAFFKVSGAFEGQKPYFRKREAISFNTDGFIGFAGWSDSKNILPLLKAFDRWMEDSFNPNKP
jgi:hypothetical protein